MKIAMRRLHPPTLTSVSCAANCGSPTAYYSQSISKTQQSSEDFRSKLLDRRWTLASPDAKVHQIMVRPKQMQQEGDLFQEMSWSNVTNPSLGNEMMKMGRQDSSFYIVRDDLIHPLINGNKARKLDALLPLLEDHSITDVVTCGGCQSAHTAAVAVSCAERGLNSHLLLRGEQPDILTGYNLISTMYGNVIYVPRSLYADREAMFQMHAASVADSDGCVVHLSEMLETFHTHEKFGSNGSRVSKENCLKKVAVINEGAGDSLALLGVIRQVSCLSENHLFGKERPINFVVDAGTGTTAVGLGLAAICLGLPWEITAVMLADTVDEYRRKEQCLISEFRRHFGFNLEYCSTQIDDGVVNWVERIQPRKFGNVMKGEVEACQRIAQQTGVLVDPVYTLAAWEMAAKLSKEEELDGAKVVMLHTGGTLGMFGLAQRYKSYFKTLKDVKMQKH